MKRTALLSLLVAAFLAGCSGGEKAPETRRTLTEHERDSTLARSKLPGAGVVGKALEVADSASARADRPLPDGP